GVPGRVSDGAGRATGGGDPGRLLARGAPGGVRRVEEAQLLIACPDRLQQQLIGGQAVGEQGGLRGGLGARLVGRGGQVRRALPGDPEGEYAQVIDQPVESGLCRTAAHIQRGGGAGRRRAEGHL